MPLLLAAVLAVQPALPTGLNVQDRPFPPLRYERFAAAPTAGPLTWDGVIQGQLGSCFFLSTLASLAKTRPRLLDAALRRDGDAYVVRLYDARGRLSEQRVDDAFPTADGRAPYFARGVSGDIRPALFEKAYAQLMGGYGAINGGEAADALLALTGTRGEDIPVSWDALTAALRDGRPPLASTPSAPVPGGPIEDHVYMVVDAWERDGRRTVRLYTPLSPADAGYSGDARVLELAFADFARLFDTLTVGR